MRTRVTPGEESVCRLGEGEGRILGASAGFEAGELLISSTTLGLSDVFGTLCGSGDGAI